MFNAVVKVWLGFTAETLGSVYRKIIGLGSKDLCERLEANLF